MSVFYCHKKGHVVADCLSLKRKQQAPTIFQHENVCLIKSVFAPAKLMRGVGNEQNPCLHSFILQGLVSLIESSKDCKKVSFVRDSAGLHSILKANALPLSPGLPAIPPLGSGGVGMRNDLASLYRVFLCLLLSGWFDVGVRPDLSVDFLLCNDVAGGKVVLIPPVIVEVGVAADSTEFTGDYQRSSEIFPACTGKELISQISFFFSKDQLTGFEKDETMSPVSSLDEEQMTTLSTESTELPAT